jgi:glucose/arabinose dehydrogenase
MNRLCWLAVAVLVAVRPAPAQEPKPKLLATELKNPISVAVLGDRTYVSLAAEADKAGTGSLVVLDKDGKTTTFAKDLDDPRGVAAYQKWLYVADKQRVLKIDLKGQVAVYAAAEAFPTPPIRLTDVVADPESGTVYVTDAGDKDKGGAVYRISAKGKTPVVSVVTDQTRWQDLQRPTALMLDGQSFVLLLDAGTGKLHRLNVASGTHEEVAAGLGQGAGLAWDWNGRLYVSDAKGRLLVIGRPGAAPVEVAGGFKTAGDICLDKSGKSILITDTKAGTLTAVRTHVPGAEVNETPLPVETVVAFPDLKWSNWEGLTEKGLPNPLRPLVLTHGGDGTNRIFVATQHGVIHVFPNDPKAKKTEVFLDIQSKVVYSDKSNEEGFLGLAFHPQFKKNGEFFVFYTIKGKKNTNVVSRFRVSKDDPNKADPTSEEELLRITDRPSWNHDGGTLCFGPDGYLYIATGDGGLANDPQGNGQNLKVLHAKILRIDVDHKDDGKNYAIPKDNPFAGRDDARGETWAYGLRNVWRMAFDRKTGQLWAADVGQNLYEEINLIVKGGNYGWKVREGLHPFSVKGSGPRKDLIDPIWEYHHTVGVSITGGTVYRGKNLPELDGAYLYGDYPSGKIWALRYDEKAKRVVENRPLKTSGQVIFSFGEDEMGEVYFLTPSNTGKGLYTFRRPGGAPKDPKAVVLTYDPGAGGFIRKGQPPYLRIQADGQVTVTDLHDGSIKEGKLTAKELEDLLRFVVQDQDFFNVTAAKIDDGIKEAMGKGPGIAIGGAGTSVIMVQANDKKHEVSYRGASAFLQTFPKVEVLGRFVAVEKRLADLANSVVKGK